ncbi:hypothetical protein NE237_029921 [Protea cynaroides]|uniref:Uncharacterized protein n=1 Tax=Protea cynaroides TaxID=273540 RepID=A0A9Q0JUC8_9MAGN|nr:hypothetical protein NE237_029921 [Protea cynaroides]
MTFSSYFRWSPIYIRKFCSSIRIRAHTSDLTLEELYNLLLCEEIANTEETNADHPTAMAAIRPPFMHGGRGFSNQGRNSSGCRGHPYNRKSYHDNSITRGLLPTPPSSGGLSQGTRPICQICQKLGHLAINCFHNHAYQERHPPGKLATMVSTPLSSTNTWYSDTGGSHHLTPNIENLHISTPYKCTDTV